MAKRSRSSAERIPFTRHTGIGRFNSVQPGMFAWPELSPGLNSRVTEDSPFYESQPKLKPVRKTP